MPNTAKHNYPGSVASYDTRPQKEMGLLYNAPEPTRGDNPLVNLCCLAMKHQGRSKVKSHG